MCVWGGGLTFVWVLCLVPTRIQLRWEGLEPTLVTHMCHWLPVAIHLGPIYWEPPCRPPAAQRLLAQDKHKLAWFAGGGGVMKHTPRKLKGLGFEARVGFRSKPPACKAHKQARSTHTCVCVCVIVCAWSATYRQTSPSTMAHTQCELLPT